MALLAALKMPAIRTPRTTGTRSATVTGGLAWWAPQAVAAPLNMPSMGMSRVNGRARSRQALAGVTGGSPREADARREVDQEDREGGSDRGVERVQEVVVEPAPALRHGADHALGQAPEQPGQGHQPREGPGVDA